MLMPALREKDCAYPSLDASSKEEAAGGTKAALAASGREPVADAWGLT